MGTSTQPVAAVSRAAWLVLALGIAAMWCSGLFLRNLWTPDEPREAVLALSMQPVPHTLPLLSGQPFAEKPPLTYWLAAGSARVFGDGPAALRVPQLFYACIALLAMIGLGRKAGGVTTGWIAGVLFATSALVYQVQIWLASDALLLAGVCVALYGMYAALQAETSAARLRFYLLMYAGCTLAFYGKNLAGLLVPVTTFVCFIAWEKRWREFARRELWIGLLLPILCIVPWLLALANSPGGLQQLRVLFWNNLVGRAISVSSEARYAYATQHRNSFGKYWIELLVYALPWSPLAVGALWRAIVQSTRGTRSVDAWPGAGSAMRFALCAVIPGLVLLSLAATARNIYAAPSMAGLALMMALWSGNAAESSRPTLRRAVQISSLLVTVMAALVFTLTLIVQRSPVAVSVRDTATFSLLVAGLVAVWGLAQATRPPAGAQTRPLIALSAALSLLLSVGTLALVQIFNHWQDLPRLAGDIQPSLAGHPVVLWHPDETTEAWTTLYLPRAPDLIIPSDDAQGVAVLNDYMAQHPEARVLALEQGPAWDWRTWRRFLGGWPSRFPGYGAGVQSLLDQRLTLLHRVDRPGGRAYWVLAGASATDSVVAR